MSERKDYKGELQHLKGRLEEIEHFKDEAKIFNKKILRIEWLHIIVACFIALIAFWQYQSIERQNLKIEDQNDKIEIQNNLLESERRGDNIILLSNLMNKIDTEIQNQNTDSETNNLSSQTIGRIISLSQHLKPYRYFENDSLRTKPLSPERGQLLVYLNLLNLSKNTFDQILKHADFNYSDLEEINLDTMYLSKARLSRSSFRGAVIGAFDFSNVSCYECDFSNTHFLMGARNRLYSDKFEIDKFSRAKFKYARLIGSKFDNSDITGIDFSFSNLSEATFKYSILNQATLYSVDDVQKSSHRITQLKESHLDSAYVDSDFYRRHYQLREIYDTIRIPARVKLYESDSTRIMNYEKLILVKK